MQTAVNFSTRVLRDAESLRELAPEWTRLWESCKELTSFQRPEWILPWVEVFQPRPLCVVEVRREGELVGLAPMFCYQRPDARFLVPLAAGITDYLDWLVLPEHANRIIGEILACLQNIDEPWEYLDLPDLPSSSLLRQQGSSFGFRLVSEAASPGLHLDAQSHTLIDVIPGSQWKNLRTARNRTRRAGGAQIEIASQETLPEFLDALLRLHQMRWQNFGMPGVLSEQAVQKFHERSAPALLRARVLRLYGLRTGGELIAVLHTMFEREVVYCYLQGFDPNYAFLSPGMQIIAAVIEDAIKEGKRLIDFLRGRETYKYSWGARDRLSYFLRASRESSTRQHEPREAA
jgi:CelD/BcsL family acetyltransferase involved in cellulose biosynthesis